MLSSYVVIKNYVIIVCGNNKIMFSSYVVITKYVACIMLNVKKSDKLCYVVDQWKVIVTAIRRRLLQ